MADPTTILEYAELRSNAATDAVTAAQQRLTEAQTAIAARRNELATATAAFADLEKRDAEIRKKLAVVPTPVDGPKLLDDLQQVIIGSRAQQAAILKAGSDLSAAQSDSVQAQAELAAASASRAKADSDLLQAKQSDSLRNGWKKALGEEPLSTIKDDAALALTEAPFTEADARVNADVPPIVLPPILRTRAAERRKAKADRFAKALESAQTAEAYLLARREKSGVDGKVESTRGMLRHAEAAARDFVNNAKSRFDQAKTLLTQVADETHSPLTPEQTAALTDTTLTTARGDAVAKEAELDGLKNDVQAQQEALDHAKLEALVDKTPANVAALVKAEGDLTTVEATLSTAEALYSNSVLDAWEAAAPDATWRLFDDFEKARAVLTMLSASDPARLATDLTDAETSYVKALLAADASDALLAQLAAEQARRDTLQQSALQTESNSLFSALRGDY